MKPVNKQVDIGSTRENNIQLDMPARLWCQVHDKVRDVPMDIVSYHVRWELSQQVCDDTVSK